MTAPYKPYKPRQVKPPEPLKVAEDIIDIIDPRIKFEIKTIALEKKYTLTTRIQPVLSIPMAYNRMTGRYELLEAPTETSARILAYYYGPTPPTEALAGYYPVALTADHKLMASIPAAEAVLSEIGRLEALGSTTTPLAASGSWTSPIDDSPATGRITGTVFADQPGTLYVDQSPDGANWDLVDSFPVSANAGLGFSVEKVAQYARVRYVNGATAQTVFRLYVYKRLRVI